MREGINGIKEIKGIKMPMRWFLPLAVAITAIGASLRFWRITSFPCGLFPDQAINGLETIRSGFQPFYFAFGEHNEGMFIILLKVFFALIGEGRWPIFALSALIGSLTIPVVILTIKRLEGRFVAVFTGLLLATSPWHIALSRSGFRAILVPLFMTLTLLLFLGFNKKTALWYISLGVTFALGFYTYPVYRFSLILAVFITFYWLVTVGRTNLLKKIKQSLIGIAIFAAAFLVTITPLVAFFIKYPEPLASRLGELSVFKERSISQGLALAGQQLKVTILGFFTTGDPNWRHNLTKQPFVQPVASLFFVVGVVGLLTKLRGERGMRAGLYLLAFICYLLPAVFSYEQYAPGPHGLRLVGEIPVIFLITALGLKSVVGLAIRLRPSLKMILPLFSLGAAAAGLFYYSFSLAFSFQNPLYAAAFRCDLTQVASFLSQDEAVRTKLAGGEKVVVVASEFDRFSLDFLLFHDPLLGFDSQKWEEVKVEPKRYSPLPTKVVNISREEVATFKLPPSSWVIVPAYGDYSHGLASTAPPTPQNQVLDQLRWRYDDLSLVGAFGGSPAYLYPNGIAFWIYTRDTMGQTIENMTVSQKVGQLFLMGIQGTSLTDDRDQFLLGFNIGGVVLYKDNIQSQEQLLAFNSGLSALAKSYSNLPFLIAIDEEGGEVSRLPWEHETTPQYLITTPQDAYAIAKRRGQELSALGVNTNLAPVVELSSISSYIGSHKRAFTTPTWQEQTKLVAATIRGYQETGILSIPKHYPAGLGRTALDPHQQLPVVEETLDTLVPAAYWYAQIARQAGAIMVTHLLYPTVDRQPASLSPIFIEGLLRQQGKYHGVVVVDDIAMGALAHLPVEEIIKDGLAAGADVFIISSPYQRQIEAVESATKLVKEGMVSLERLDQTVARILRFKQQLQPPELKMLLLHAKS